MHRPSLSPVLKLLSSATLFAILCASPFAGQVYSQDASDDAKTAFDSLFAEQISRARATPNKADDVALAKELLAAASSSVEHKGLLTLICDAAYSLGSAQRDGYETAMSAQRLLAEYIPEQREQAVGKMLQLRRRQYATSKTLEERKLVAGQLLRDYISAANTAEAAEDFKGATNYLRSAGQLAASVKSPLAPQISNRYRSLLGRRQLAEDAAVHIEALNKDPKNSVAAMQLVMLYIELADRPGEAIGYAPLLADEATKKLVTLAAEDPNSIADTDLLKLADWYRSLAERSTSRNRPGMYGRAFGYYSLFLNKNSGKNSLAKTKAKLMISRIQSAAKRGGFTVTATKTASADKARAISAAGGLKSAALIPANFNPISVPIATGGNPKLSAALYKGVNKGDLDRVRKAIADGAGVNLSHDRTTILISAFRAQENRFEIIQLLLSKGADPNAVGRNKQSPLWLACNQNALAISRVLRQYGANADKDALTLAAKVKDVEWMTALLAAGADPNKPLPTIDKRYEFSIFFHAIGGGKRSAFIGLRTLQIVKLLLAKGANPNQILMRDVQKDRAREFTTLTYAAMTAPPAVYEALLAAGAESKTPLHDAVSAGNMAQVEKLSTDPKVLNQRSDFNDTPLIRAINTRPMNLKIIQLLIARGANVNGDQKSETKRTGQFPLQAALRGASYSDDGLKAFGLLIKAGADPKAVDHNQTSLLHLAAQMGRSEHVRTIAKILISKGADVNAKANKNRTPLDYARDKEMIALLKSAGGKSGKKR